VRPAKQGTPAGGQTDEIGTVDIINDDTIGYAARTYATTGTVPSDVTVERIDQLHQFVASVNFYRRPPTASYLRGFTVSAVVDDVHADRRRRIRHQHRRRCRKVFGIDLTGVAIDGPRSPRACRRGWRPSWPGRRATGTRPTPGSW
jgi:hypothetical protein